MIELNTIYNENNLDTMSRIPNLYLDGIITSPPYNIFKTEGYVLQYWIFGNG